MSTVNGVVSQLTTQHVSDGSSASPNRVSSATRARVLITGAVPLPVQAEASHEVAAAFEAADALGADVRLRLTWDPDDRPRPAVAQVNADVDGRALRAQVSAEDLGAIVAAIVDRVRAQLPNLTRLWTPRAAPQEAKAWPARSARPSGERELVRTKCFGLDRLTPDEAMRHMDAMDYNFHLFESAESGDGSLIYRIGPTGYRLSTPTPHQRRPDGLGPPLTWHREAVLRFPLGEALELLNRTDFPFVFFYEQDVARVLYRRFDGHYGLISGLGH